LCSPHQEHGGPEEYFQVSREVSSQRDSLRGLFWQRAPPGLSTSLHRTWCSKIGFWKELREGQVRKDGVLAWSMVPSHYLIGAVVPPLPIWNCQSIGE
jgi:hypothetical protein